MMLEDGKAVAEHHRRPNGEDQLGQQIVESE
jgi:hypothetical protein